MPWLPQESLNKFTHKLYKLISVYEVLRFWEFVSGEFMPIDVSFGFGKTLRKVVSQNAVKILKRRRRKKVKLWKLCDVTGSRNQKRFEANIFTNAWRSRIWKWLDYESPGVKHFQNLIFHFESTKLGWNFYESSSGIIS